MTPLDQVTAIVRSWRDDTELSAARAMYEIAKVLGVEPTNVAGRKRRPEQSTRTAHPSEDRNRIP